MPSLQIKETGAWKKIKPHINVNGTWKKIKKAYEKDNGVWKKFYIGAVLPVGIILPYISEDVAPSGFEPFTLANDTLIRGSDGTNIGESGGSSTISISTTTSTTGAHTGSGTRGGQIYSQRWYGNASKGGHNHFASGTSGNILPSHKTTRLIKAIQEIDYIPKDVAIFGDSTDWENLSEVATGNRFLKASDTNWVDGGIAEGSIISIACSTSIAGSHNHVTSFNHDADDENHSIDATRGGHSHLMTMTGANKLPSYIYLSVWSNAIENTDVESGLIGMWESDTIPDGWNICNGENGTPDLTEHFLRLGDSSNHGTETIQQDSDITFTGTTNNGIAHNHITSYGGDADNNLLGKHTSNYTTGSHTASQIVSFVPSYYRLVFIKKID